LQQKQQELLLAKEEHANAKLEGASKENKKNEQRQNAK
jgi:hypothetical protein